MGMATENKKLVPELRFVEFTNDWSIKKLGSIADLTSSKRVYLSDYVEEGIPFYRGKEISELKQNKQPQDILYISEEAFDKFDSKYGSPRENDILITAVGTLGNVYRVPNNSKFYFKDGNLIWLKNVKEYSKFLELIIGYNKRLLIKCSIGSTQKALTIVELNKIPLKLPSIKEQQKIANFLTSIDQRITLLKEKKVALEDYKKGLMQKIFSQEVRFKDDGKDFPDWEEKRLDDIADCLDNKRKPLNSTSRQDMKGSIPYYGANGVVDYLNDYLFDQELILLAEDGGNFDEFANRPIAQYVTGKSWVNNHAHVLSCKGENIGLMLYYSLVHKDVRKYINGSSRAKLNKSDMLSIKLLWPRSIEEQQKIADCLNSIDQSINHLSKQIDQTNEFKKGLLQRMFV